MRVGIVCEWEPLMKSELKWNLQQRKISDNKAQEVRDELSQSMGFLNKQKQPKRVFFYNKSSWTIQNCSFREALLSVGLVQLG